MLSMDTSSPSPRRTLTVPTVEEIVQDELTTISLKYWAGPEGEREPFDQQLVEQLYKEELLNGLERVMMLELSRYLELYLWPNFSDDSPPVFVKSIVMMVNEKFRENVPDPWACFEERHHVFPSFFNKALSLAMDGSTLSEGERVTFVIFLINCFQSMGNDMVRKQCLRLTYLPLWTSVNPGRVSQELLRAPESVQQRWAKVHRRHKKSLKKKKKKSPKLDYPKCFLPRLLDHFLSVLGTIKDATSPQKILFCERFVELLIDLMAQLTTRRFFHLVLSDKHVVVLAKRSVLFRMEEGSLFNELVEMLRFYETFEIDNFTGVALSEENMTAAHCSRISHLQKIAFKEFPDELKELALSNIQKVEENLADMVSPLTEAQLSQLCTKLHLTNEEDTPSTSKEFFVDVLCAYFEKRHSQLDTINETGLYPTEDILWDYNMVPSEVYGGEGSLALPKLNLQFLTFHDYLLRNFNLFKLGATNDIRDDIVDAVRRMNPRRAVGGKRHTTFHGWARMAMSIGNFKVVKVERPRLGERKPSVVRAHIQVDLSLYQGKIREEWEALKLHDVVYLVSVRSLVEKGSAFDMEKPANERYGIQYCRGCEIFKVLDQAENQMNVVNPTTGESVAPVGDKRTLCVWLDSAQYLRDKEQEEEDIYSSFNLLVRRKPKENNFKAVLATIRDLMNSEFSVPEWLHDLFLGYGDGHQGKETESTSLDFSDTFVSREHLEASFAPKKVVVMSETEPPPPASSSSSPSPARFRVTFPPEGSESGRYAAHQYQVETVGPYGLQDTPRGNTLAFTKTQVSAIASAMRGGLTLVVGPPGTGKTDVAVQIVSNLYHSFPDQKTLIITHSNQALNQIFQKIMHLDVDERHLMRLGHGQKMLDTLKDFSKVGRINYMLALRLDKLEQVHRLAQSLGVEGDVGWSCETASHFRMLQVDPRWSAFLKAAESESSGQCVSRHFPFIKFFQDAEQPLFSGKHYQEDMAKARSCYKYISDIFKVIEESRPLELLRSTSDRGNYLLTKQARIVAMTCTHAALKRRELVEMGFQYDNVVMEEAAQILEIETFIPMLLQKQKLGEQCRLKRVTLIGDHNQLPPVVKNLALQKFSHLDQSLFSRFIRLGIPHITLDAQGRCRASLASLFNWRYPKLGNLREIAQNEEYQRANGGFQFDYQVVDVGPFQGKGETAPSAYFYQNLGEAEYIAATFMYMRLLGYPADKISVITSYNGQKHLLKDVFQRRCAAHPLFGMPKRISTVDRFQGQQNDYILLSLVRTKTVGHIRDVRRLVVAMSRARLGLYVFCRKQLFQNCYELTKVFAKLNKRPSKLHLVENETYATTTRHLEDTVESPVAVEDVAQMQQVVTKLITAQSPGDHDKREDTSKRPREEETPQIANEDTPKKKKGRKSKRK